LPNEEVSHTNWRSERLSWADADARSAATARGVSTSGKRGDTEEITPTKRGETMNIAEKIAGLVQTPPVFAYKNALQVAHELHACIGCNECLLACPAIGSPLTIDRLNRETLSGPISPDVARFARSCYQCGACVKPCPVGLHRDSMMMLLKRRLLQAKQEE
jgi:ferredoxin